MKTKKSNFKEKTVLSIIFCMLLLLKTPIMYAQTASPNVRVNTADYYQVSLDGGGKSIAALNDTVYTVWQGKLTDSTGNIYFAKSIDGGNTFSADLKIFQGPDSILHAFPSLAVNQNGIIYVASTAVTPDYNIWFTKSIDGGSTFTTPAHITTLNSYIFPSIGAYNDNVYILYADAADYPLVDYYFVRSTNNGQTFETPIKINDASCNGGVKFEGLSSLTIDESGIIYLAWVDGRRANGNGDIFFAKSTDNGQSFSTNVMVNDINQPGVDSVQYMPSIAVDGPNNVYISFTDQRLGSDWQYNRAYLCKSTNGGSTFSTESFLAGFNQTCKSHNIAVSSSGELSVAICANIAPSWGVWLFESNDGGNNFSSPIALCDTFDTDYSDLFIVYNSNEDIFALWKDPREVSYNVYFSKVDLGVNVTENKPDNKYALYPNPTNGSFSVEMPFNSTNTEIAIYNLQGQMFYNKFFDNTSIVNIDIEMPQGIYFITIKSNDEIKTLKLIKN